MRKQLVSLAKVVKSQRQLTHLLRYHPVYYSKVKSILSRVASADRAHREKIVSELLISVLKKAQKTPYGHNRSLQIEEWPILAKDKVKESPAKFQTKVCISTPAATSGSSGIPLKLRRGLLNIAAEQACLDSLVEKYGVSFRSARIAVLRGDNVKKPSDWSPPYGEYRDDKYLMLSLPHLKEDTLDWFVDELKKFRPEILWVYPTGADFLASLCQKHNISLSLPLVLSSSEMLLPQARTRIEEAFGSVVLDYYGQAERVCLSYQSEPEKAWFHPGYGYVELFPTEEPAVNGLCRAKIIATGYWKTKMPLIRYDTGDYISYPAHYTEEDLKEVALGIQPFVRLEGRQSEYLLTPDGGRVQALNNIPYEVNHLRKAQFIQHSLSEVEVRLDVEDKFDEKDLSKFMKNARAKITDEITLDIKRDVPLIKTDVGKTPFLIQKIKAEV